MKTHLPGGLLFAVLVAWAAGTADAGEVAPKAWESLDLKGLAAVAKELAMAADLTKALGQDGGRHLIPDA